MMEAVQPFVDTAISKTVNIPADYSYADFRQLYVKAWAAELKGLATYRPNSILGSVLSTTPEPAKTTAPAVDPMRTVMEKWPKGSLPAVAEKIEHVTQDGQKTLYVVVSFIPITDPDTGETVERAIELFYASRTKREIPAMGDRQHAPTVARCSGRILRTCA